MDVLSPVSPSIDISGNDGPSERRYGRVVRAQIYL